MSSSVTAEALERRALILADDRTPLEVASSKTPQEMEDDYFDWNLWAFDKQLPPAGEWTTWLLLGGRGSGKTRAGAEWVRRLAASEVSPIALVGETMMEAVSIMVRGDSGILSVHPERERPVLKADHRLVWPNGVEAMILSASDPDRFRGPQFAAAWCDELGCGAVDKGANQPNIFGDPKSGESGRPYFSTGLPDPLIQRQVLRAHQRHWQDAARNPPGMVDVDRIYHWTWDARPYPAFPAQTAIWADGPNHRNGHWLTGRLGAASTEELVQAIADDHGVAMVAGSSAPLVSGYVLGTATTARAALEPVIEATGMRLRSAAGGLVLDRARRGAVTELAPDGLVADDGPVLSRRRTDPAEAPGRLAYGYLDRERDYLAGTVTAIAQAEGPLAAEAGGLVLDAAGARMAAERLLDVRAVRRETLDLTLPPSALALEPGDLVDVAGLAEGPFEIVEIRDGPARRVTARTLPVGGAITTGIDRPLSVPGSSHARAIPVAYVAHLPPEPAEPTRSRLAVAGYADPWPGPLRLADETTGASLIDLRRAGIGELASALPAGPEGIWDAGSVEVIIRAGHLAAADEAAVLAGRNRLAVETDSGAWEVLGFAEANLIAPGRYRLTRLLRGLAGTGPAIGPAAVGRRIMLLDGRVGVLPVEVAGLGEERNFRIYGGSTDLTGVPVTVTTALGPALPLPPVHLRAERLAGGDIAIRWVRRSRADGDGWGVAEAPLEHLPERYRLTIRDDTTVVRTLETAMPLASYAAAEQVADFGALPATFDFTIAQISAVLGVGHAAQGEFHG